jgi:NAD(P)-dependent dehydrogenase (short-subunit alcohol dehydrogenase family)
MKKFENKRAVITGAGSGLGRALAMELAQDNWKILVSDVRDETAQETLEMVKKAGGSGETFHCDVTDLTHLEAMADKVFNEWGGVDLLINNAGVLVAGNIGDMPIDNWKWVIDINVWGTINGCHAFIPRMKKQGSGHIVNVASAAGFTCLPEMGAYNLTKAALIGLTETLLTELSPHNIDVTAVCPSVFSSNLIDGLRHDTDGQRDWWNVMFRKATMNAQQVASEVIKAVKQNKPYIIPQREVKIAHLMKRLSPKLYFNSVKKHYKKGMLSRS